MKKKGRNLSWIISKADPFLDKDMIFTFLMSVINMIHGTTLEKLTKLILGTEARNLTNS